MIQETCQVTGTELVTEETFVVSFESKRIAETIQPGQFVNVRSWFGSDPLLRRPFSVYTVDRDRFVSILFNVVGKGTRILGGLRKGDLIDVIGPLGTPFNLNLNGMKTAVLVGGGLGVAPLPVLTSRLKEKNVRVHTYLGARSKSQLIPSFLENLSVATDDGSSGFHGTVVDLLERELPELDQTPVALFGCGPNPMLRGLSALASKKGIACQISLEGPMGCGFGICQGCPVRLSTGAEEYVLMCREGPVFDSTLIEV
ncbi:MAG: dihydroorotate dehydrogenase electron transfer subunit [Ignavibacteria bacterium]|nr:dihydroorotate dehydrogenase electron transfer subunit [Ignavibacteria bacterium]